MEFVILSLVLFLLLVFVFGVCSALSAMLLDPDEMSVFSLTIQLPRKTDRLVVFPFVAVVRQVEEYPFGASAFSMFCFFAMSKLGVKLCERRTISTPNNSFI